MTPKKLLYLLINYGAMLCLVCIAQGTFASTVAKAVDLDQPIVIKVENNLLTASAREVPLHVILKKIADQTGLGFEMYGQVDRPITIELKNIPLNRGIKRILKGCNSTIIYTDHSSLESAAIHKIIIFDKYGGSSGPPIQTQNSRIPPPAKISSSASRQKKQRKPHTTARKWPKKSAEKTSIEAYAEQLSSEHWEQRREAVFDIADEYPEEALSHLEQALLSDSNEEVRALAAEKIGELANKEGLDALAKGIHDPDLGVREAVITALGEIGTAETLPALQEALQDSSEEIRDAAAELIAEISTQELETVDQLVENATFFTKKTTGQAGGRKPKKGEK